jgi:hypothetical protein
LEDNIKIDLKLDRKVWTGFLWLRIRTSGAAVYAVMNIRVLLKEGNFINR